MKKILLLDVHKKPISLKVFEFLSEYFTWISIHFWEENTIKELRIKNLDKVSNFFQGI